MKPQSERITAVTANYTTANYLFSCLSGAYLIAVIPIKKKGRRSYAFAKEESLVYYTFQMVTHSSPGPLEQLREHLLSITKQ
jgi:hypothetical protein